MREEGQSLEVRCTWEGGDAERFAQEAVADGVDVLDARGGDGTLHEARE
jgi:diacylglycerol kinase family enzyme